MKPLLISHRSISRWLKSVVLAGCLSLLCVPMAIAQTNTLTRAQIYRLQNIVNLLLQNQSLRPARLQDILVPRDAMETGSQSRAELFFNDNSVARVGSSSVFRFVPGMRSDQLPDGSTRAEAVLQLQRGVALIVSPAGGEAVSDFGEDDGSVPSVMASIGPTQTPDLKASGSAYLLIVTPEGSTVIALTDGTVLSDIAGENTIPLQGGQTVTAKEGVFGPVETFDLRQLYRTSALTFGLGPDEEAQLLQEPAAVQDTLRQARQDTLSAIAAQDATLQGLCTLDARGGDSTLSSNCVTTGADDPLSEFEDQREDATSVEDPNPPGSTQSPPGGGLNPPGSTP